MGLNRRGGFCTRTSILWGFTALYARARVSRNWATVVGGLSVFPMNKPTCPRYAVDVEIRVPNRPLHDPKLLFFQKIHVPYSMGCGVVMHKHKGYLKRYPDPAWGIWAQYVNVALQRDRAIHHHQLGCALHGKHICHKGSAGNSISSSDGTTHWPIVNTPTNSIRLSKG